VRYPKRKLKRKKLSLKHKIKKRAKKRRIRLKLLQAIVKGWKTAENMRRKYGVDSGFRLMQMMQDNCNLTKPEQEMLTGELNG